MFTLPSSVLLLSSLLLVLINLHVAASFALSMSSAPVLVFGATGHCGREVVKKLTEKGIETHAFVRDVEKAAKMLPEGMPLHEGDMADPQAVLAAFKASQAKRVFLSCNNGAHQLSCETNVVDQAIKSSVDHLVKLSTAPCAVKMGPHYAVEQALEEGSIKYTSLRPHYFYQNLIQKTIAVGGEYDPAQVVPAKTFKSHLSRGVQSMVDTRDVAMAAAAILALDEEGLRTHESRDPIYVLTGPAAFDMRQAAAEMSEVLVGDASRTAIQCEHEDVEQTLSKFPEAAKTHLITFFNAIAAECTAVTDDLQLLSNHKPRTFAQFLADHKHEFGVE